MSKRKKKESKLSSSKGVEGVGKKPGEMELTVNGQKMWFDFEAWKAHKEWLDKLQGL